MNQDNGGIIGKINTPTTSLASGVWSLDSQFDSQSSSIWPLAFPNTTIANACRFDDGSSDSLQRTPSSAGNRRTWTWSGWVKRADSGSFTSIFGTDATNQQSGYSGLFGFQSTDEIFFGQGDINTRITNRKFRDFSAWYHFVVALDTTQATASDRVKIYVNGVQETSFSTSTDPSQNFQFQFNNNVVQSIGCDVNNSGARNFFGGYIAEVVFVDGQQLLPTSFGAFNPVTNIWEPIAYAGTYGTNGFRLDFADSSALGNDVSGNDNDFTVNNLTSVDQASDTCSNNFATLNPLDNSSVTLSEGNLKASCPSPSGCRSTIAVESGKWYVEVKYTETASFCGVVDISQIVTSTSTSSVTLFGGSSGQPELFLNGSAQSDYSSAGTLSAGDIIQIALDKDNNNVYFGKNGSWFGGTNWTESSPTTAHALSSGSSYVHGFRAATGSGTRTNEWNFGNPPYSISSGNADANGHGNFEYAVPSGYFSLCTKNLAEFGG